MFKTTLALLGLGVILYVCLGLVLFFNQSRLIYFPSQVLATTPQAHGIGFEEISFRTADSISLTGWFVPSGKESDVILFFHGNAGNISHRMDSISLFHQLGYSVFIFDYRGYGTSEGTPTEAGTYRDGEAAWKYLVEDRNINPEKIIIFGRSLGGAVAAGLAQQIKPKAYILESTFTSVPDMAKSLYPIFPAHLISRYKYDALSALPAIQAPLMVIHSPEDEIVPYTHGRRLFEAAPEPKMFLEISGDHNNGFITSRDKYTKGLRSFFRSL